MTPAPKVAISAAKLAARVAATGREISRDYAGRTLDLVAIMDNSFVFAADLVRYIKCPIVCHFVRAEIRDVNVGGYERKEIFFSPEPVLRDRDVLLVDAVLQSGVTLDFWAKRLMDSRPRSLRTAVLIDKPQERKVDFQPDYFCFETASNHLVGYGLPEWHGLYRNLPFVGVLSGTPRKKRASRKTKKSRKKK
ncbi:MAG TPA: phosphoribosyltransferase family protein [Candidatus Acidoferrales bacterium]|nr:phosphoribosyltransferase family protein [Candidatus Acidoferrales bacterium]